VTSFSGVMLTFTALVLFVLAFGEIREGRIGAAIALGAVAAVLCSIAASID
jgi:hypothetical protein